MHSLLHSSATSVTRSKSALIWFSLLALVFVVFMGLALYLLLTKRRVGGFGSQDEQTEDGHRKEALGSSDCPASTPASPTTATTRDGVPSAQSASKKSARSGIQKTGSKKAASGHSAQ